MADSAREKMQRAAGGLGQRPTPKLPKIPDSIKRGTAKDEKEKAEAWTAYDQDWERFFKEIGQIQK